jgi:acetate kinase
MPRMTANDATILTINSGSSSVKFSLYRMGAQQRRIFSGILNRIGMSDSQFLSRDAAGASLVDQECVLGNHHDAFRVLLAWLAKQDAAMNPNGVGHRIVHGGVRYTEPARIEEPDLAALREIIPLAPNHLPSEITAIEALREQMPGVPQIGCFDTAFHAGLPPTARFFALPRELRERHVRRFGFHGLSYQFLVDELRRVGDAAIVDGRVILAHLGNGASMAAVQAGRGVDTTMGLTPLGGFLMSQRPGDLDPGVILYLLNECGLRLDELTEMLVHRSGLLGVSGLSSDMHDLLEREANHEGAAEAIAMFCYQVRKQIAAMAAAMGGLDTLVFTAGIGERSPVIRQRICDGLDFMGIRIDRKPNDANEPVISTPDAPVTVRVMKTNEELTIARQTAAFLQNRA